MGCERAERRGGAATAPLAARAASTCPLQQLGCSLIIHLMISAQPHRIRRAASWSIRSTRIESTHSARVLFALVVLSPLLI